MIEKYVVTEHAIERYCNRVQREKATDDEIKRRIKKDLHYTKIKKIITRSNIKFVFTQNSKEFIFIKRNNMWVLKTIIKRTRENNLLAINKRLAS